MSQATPELDSLAASSAELSKSSAAFVSKKLNHLQALEAESIFILREAVAEFATR